MRTSSNPAFRNLPVGSAAGAPYAGYDQGGYGAAQTATGADDRPMTVDDVVMKTGASIGVALLTGVITAIWARAEILAGGSTGAVFGVAIVAVLVGLGLALFISFKQKASAGLTLGYSAVEGVFLGAITGVFELMVPGVALQAILGTALVFITMLTVYKTGAVKVTPKLRKWVVGAAMAAFGLVLVNLLLSFVGIDLGVRGNGPLGIIIGLVFIGIAAFMLLLDFDMADNMIRAGMPQKWAWFAAFGLMTTLVWLYFEMIRLLWALQSE
ncbi:MAG: hypothetical protein GEU97_16210 [Actinophytocola sp.]|nr:hypothetical protein [Actinophytocola sp.]